MRTDRLCWSRLLLAACGALAAGGCAGSRTSNWQPTMARLPAVKFTHDGHAKIRSIRNFRFLSEEDYVEHYYDGDYDLKTVRTVDFIVVPFQQLPSLAHTMLSFGFADGRRLVVSVEARLKEDQTYSLAGGLSGQYDLMYLVGDERDLIPLRTEHRQADVFIYPARVTPERVRELLVDMLRRADQLRVQPETYHLLTNNCTTNIVRHVNRLRPGRIPLSLGVLLPGHSDRLAYDLGLIDTSVPFAQLRQQAHVNARVAGSLDAGDFSAAIRR